MKIGVIGISGNEVDKGSQRVFFSELGFDDTRKISGRLTEQESERNVGSV